MLGNVKLAWNKSTFMLNLCFKGDNFERFNIKVKLSLSTKLTRCLR